MGEMSWKLSRFHRRINGQKNLRISSDLKKKSKENYLDLNRELKETYSDLNRELKENYLDLIRELKETI